MSTAAGSPSKEIKPSVGSPKRPNKGKGKGKDTEPLLDDEIADEDDEDDEENDEENDEEDDEEDGEMEDEDDENVDWGDSQIDPRAIVGPRTRGIKVDYTSKEALAKAGLGEESDDDDEDMKHE